MRTLGRIGWCDRKSHLAPLWCDWKITDAWDQSRETGISDQIWYPNVQKVTSVW